MKKKKSTKKNADAGHKKRDEAVVAAKLACELLSLLQKYPKKTQAVALFICAGHLRAGPYNEKSVPIIIDFIKNNIALARKNKAAMGVHEMSPEEITLAMHEMMTHYYRDWITMSIPALGGKTPKQLSKTSAGRRKLAGTLKGVENSVRHLERDTRVLRPLDLGWLWEELGVDRKAA